MRSPSHALIRCLRHPSEIATLSPNEWPNAIAAADQTNLSTRVALLANAQGNVEWLAGFIQDQLPRVDHQARLATLEIDELATVFQGTGIPAMLLKGAAYLAAQLPVANGRIFSDFDVLVPKAHLDDAEHLLERHGWVAAPKSDLDKQYFREWLHEIAPMVHLTRHTTVDLHHNILPSTDRLQFDPSVLWSRAVTLECGLLVPCLEDMALHCATHLFRNGEFRNGLRDLHDFHLLLSDHRDEAFWTALVKRAQELGLTQPCALGLRYATRLFDTPVPPDVLHRTEGWLGLPLRMIFDRLVDYALLNRYQFHTDMHRETAISLLSYWPIPRPKVMATWLFWAKRWRKTETAR